jgi:two-component system cell cycle sensor histidine kinase/response regulator CckA
VHLKKAILNLLVNAFDAMSECDKGTLSLAVSQGHLQQLDSGFAQVPPGRYVKVSVADTGKGIAPADRHRIFEPYFSKKAMTGSSGSGLGLSVVYGVLKDHGGYYDLHSEEGRRTEFLLYFPASDLRAEVQPAQTKVARGTETVLVVEDSLDQRDLVQEMLGSLGYQVHTVENGYQAVAFLQTHRVDIVLLDMIMADSLDGLDTYRELLKVQPAQKALIVSGYSATERVEEACRLGVGGYVRKPYTLEQIGSALRQVLDRTEVQPSRTTKTVPALKS